MSIHEPGRPTPRIALEACAHELRRRCEAVASLQGGSAYYQEELGIFRDFAREKGLYLRSTPSELSRPPDEEGNQTAFFTANGWLRFNIGGEIAFFDPESNVVISDTHRGNIILMDDGLLAPIDLRVEAISGSLLDTVVKLCKKHPV